MRRKGPAPVPITGSARNFSGDGAYGTKRQTPNCDYRRLRFFCREVVLGSEAVLEAIGRAVEAKVSSP